MEFLRLILCYFVICQIWFWIAWTTKHTREPTEVSRGETKLNLSGKIGPKNISRRSKPLGLHQVLPKKLTAPNTVTEDDNEVFESLVTGSRTINNLFWKNFKKVA